MASDTGTVWSLSVKCTAETIDGLFLLIEGIFDSSGRKITLMTTSRHMGFKTKVIITSYLSGS